MEAPVTETLVCKDALFIIRTSLYDAWLDLSLCPFVRLSVCLSVVRLYIPCLPLSLTQKPKTFRKSKN